MNRRLTVAIAATAALGLSAAGAPQRRRRDAEEPDHASRAASSSRPASASRTTSASGAQQNGQVGRDRHGASTRPRPRIRTRSPSSRSAFLPGHRFRRAPAAVLALRPTTSTEDDPRRHPTVSVDDGVGGRRPGGDARRSTRSCTDRPRATRQFIAPGQKTIPFKVTAAEGLESVLLLRNPPLDAGQAHASSNDDAIGPAHGRGRRHFTRGLAAIALPALAVVLGPSPPPPRHATSGWRRCRRRGTPCPTPATRSTAPASRPRRRCSPRSSTGATRAAGASRSGSPTRRAAPPGASTAR